MDEAEEALRSPPSTIVGPRGQGELF